MQFGMPTLIENRNLEENAELCSELGLDFLELNMNMPMYQVDKIGDIHSLLELAERYGIYYTIHLDENLNVCDFNEAVAEAYLDTVRRTIQIAEELGCPVINMHMNKGVYFTLPDRKIYLFEQYREWYLEGIRRFRKICENVCKDAEVLISIENTDGFTNFQREAVEYLLESRVFSLTWDVGHSYVDAMEDERFILEHEEKLAHFHMHDAIGRRNHLALGTGEVDLAERFKAAGRNKCRCVLETKTVQALRESVAWMRRNGIMDRYL